MPEYLLPDLQVKTPWPLRLSSLYSPTYLLPFAQLYAPTPWRLSSRKSPSYLSPLAKVNTPGRCACRPCNRPRMYCRWPRYTCLLHAYYRSRNYPGSYSCLWRCSGPSQAFLAVAVILRIDVRIVTQHLSDAKTGEIKKDGQRRRRKQLYPAPPSAVLLFIANFQYHP